MMDRRKYIALLVLLVVGIGLRIRFNDVAAFSRADETTYLEGARALAPGVFARFPQFAADYAKSPELWAYPPPTRWGHWALVGAACSMSSECGFHTLAWLSTLGGIAALIFTGLLARELLGEKAALVAVALSLAAPLQLHLGRRALQDELAAAATLAALWAVARALSIDPEKRTLGRHLVAVIVCTLALAEKETALLWAPALAGLWLVRHRARGWRKEDLLFALPPLLFIAGFCVLSRSFTLFFIDVRANFSSLDGSSYVAQYMSGPLHRYPFDLFLLAPIVFPLAVAASGVALLDESPEARGLREAALLLALGLAVWVNTPKDVRYVAAVDGLLRILAAWILVALASRRRRDLALVALLLCVNFGWELRLFHRVSVERAIYDPTTFGILNALDAIPR